MKTFLPIAILLVVVPATSVLAQDTKPSAAVAPLAAIGNISEAQKRIIHTSLGGLLAQSYKLVADTDYKKAEEIAFQELDLAQCTEEQCIRKIQEILQVDRLFVLQIIREADYTQLSLVLVRADDRLVKVETCDRCSIRKLNASVERLYRGIVAEDREGPAVSPVVKAPEAALPEPEAPPEPASPLTGWRWKWGSALAFGLLAAGYANTESQAVDDSNTRQQELVALMESASTTAEFNSYASELQSEKDAAATHKDNSDAGIAVSAILLGVTAWIYFDPPEENTSSAMILPLPLDGGAGLSIALVSRW